MLKLGICQYHNSYRWDKTFEYAIKTIDYFSKRNVDIVCFQEAFLSGYTAESIMLPYEYIEEYLEKIKLYAYKKNICVHIGSLRSVKDKLYNSIHIFNADGKDHVIYKQGLTPSEKVMMNPKMSKKKFKLKGYNIGVIICRELEDPAFTYIEKSKKPDLILWPSYWGWGYKHKWGSHRSDGETNKCFVTNQKQKTPIIQINMSYTSLGNGKKLKAGKSVIIDKNNNKVGVGAYGKDDRFIVEFNNGKLIKRK